MLHKYLLDEQFEQSLVDPCVYTTHKGESKVTIVVCVDDIIVAANNTQSIVEMKHSLRQRFKMKDLGRVRNTEQPTRRSHSYLIVFQH